MFKNFKIWRMQRLKFLNILELKGFNEPGKRSCKQGLWR